ncbi:MAG TPA: tRNA pseudouridine(38-40) synthase TruA [Lentimicrobium sp.]|nr:tRNA pseudouridine(38-40) synthase TruA [Lentimicrobium sp.]
METYRYFLNLAYNGASFHGWQLQKNAHSVQSELEEALFYCLNKKAIKLTGAGRTDAGVHARNYYAHFDHDEKLSNEDLNQLVYHLNQILPESIGVYGAFNVRADAHARFSALSRTYKYYICRDHDPFKAGISYRLTIPLDIGKLQEASQMILSYMDFTCFTKSGANTTSNICTVYQSFWEQHGNMLVYQTRANRFLRNMVRAMVGTLIDIGKGRTSLEEFANILEKGTRSDAGQSVPACGLFLENIDYPDDIKIIP